MLIKYGELGDTFVFPFAVNDTSGSGVDGSGFTADVRLVGAATSAAPVYSVSADLVSHANFPPGCWEVTIAGTVGNGFADNSEYSVYVSGTADGQTPVGYVGSFMTGKLLTSADFGLIKETTIATLATQSSFTLTAGSDQDNAYNDLHMTITDADNTDRIDAVYMSDYTGSTKTATMGQATATFSAAVGDKVRIYGYKSPILLATATALSAVSAKLPTALTGGGAIKADVYSVNETEIGGTGVAGDYFGPA
jgi:hypothetical protein